MESLITPLDQDYSKIRLDDRGIELLSNAAKKTFVDALRRAYGGDSEQIAESSLVSRLLLQL